MQDETGLRTGVQPARVWISKIRWGSRLEESYDVLKADRLEEEYGANGVRLKAHLVKVGDGHLAQSGVLRHDPAAIPKLIMWSERVWERNVPKLTADTTYYSEQPSVVFSQLTEGAAKNFGQTLGGKYHSHKKVVKAYTDSQLRQLAVAAQAAARAPPAPSDLDAVRFWTNAQG